jgi:hypothetical protein
LIPPRVRRRHGKTGEEREALDPTSVSPFSGEEREALDSTSGGQIRGEPGEEREALDPTSGVASFQGRSARRLIPPLEENFGGNLGAP